MFWGHHTHALDAEGSMTLPDHWRTELGQSVVVTRGLDRCLFLYPGERFTDLARAFEHLTFGAADARALVRYLFSGAIDVKPDRQGRITICQELLHFAGIEREAVVAGVNDRIEIWEPGHYAEVDARVEADVNTVAERMGTAMQQLFV